MAQRLCRAPRSGQHLRGADGGAPPDSVVRGSLLSLTLAAMHVPMFTPRRCAPASAMTTLRPTRRTRRARGGSRTRHPRCHPSSTGSPVPGRTIAELSLNGRPLEVALSLARTAGRRDLPREVSSARDPLPSPKDRSLLRVSASRECPLCSRTVWVGTFCTRSGWCSGVRIRAIGMPTIPAHAAPDA
jgi:hypothetical protein